jgi:LacI family transcriptional regulator
MEIRIMTVSQRTIAERVGVSRTAVTHVLNGRAERVSPAVRERILKTIEETDYHRNGLVRAMQRKRTQVLGLVLNHAGGYFSRLVASIESTAKAHDYQCFLCQTHSVIENMEKEVATLREYRVDGLILMPVNSMEHRDFYRRLLARRVPFVLLDMAVEGVDVPCARNDDVAIGRLATQHLLALGHRRIACLRGYPKASNAWDRERGYREALAAAGLPVREDLIVGNSYIAEGGREAVRELLGRNTEFTALFAANDAVAYGAIEELRRHGRRVPEDVSVVGVGNDESCGWVSPRLTSVDQKPDDVGRAAVELLLARIDKTLKPADQVRLIEPELVERESAMRVG